MRAGCKGMDCKGRASFVVVVLLVGMAVYPAFGQQKGNLGDALDEFYDTKTQSKIHLMWLGKHQIGNFEGFSSAGYMLKTSDSVVLIDSSSLLDEYMDSVQKIDLILVTHTHGDHFIPESTISLQQKTGATVVANPEAFSVLQGSVPGEKLVNMPPLETKDVQLANGKSAKVHSFLAEHPVEDPVVYLVNVDGFVVFHGADSGFVNSLNQLQDTEVHVSIVPTGDPSPSASPADAYKMIQATSPYVAYTMHGSDLQNKEFASMVRDDDSLSTNVVIPQQYETITPTGVVPEFGLHAGLVTVVALFSVMFFVVYAKRTKKQQSIFKEN